MYYANLIDPFISIWLKFELVFINVAGERFQLIIVCKTVRLYSFEEITKIENNWKKYGKIIFTWNS